MSSTICLRCMASYVPDRGIDRTKNRSSNDAYPPLFCNVFIRATSLLTHFSTSPFLSRFLTFFATTSHLLQSRRYSLNHQYRLQYLTHYGHLTGYEFIIRRGIFSSWNGIFTRCIKVLLHNREYSFVNVLTNLLRKVYLLPLGIVPWGNETFMNLLAQSPTMSMAANLRGPLAWKRYMWRLWQCFRLFRAQVVQFPIIQSASAAKWSQWIVRLRVSYLWRWPGVVQLAGSVTSLTDVAGAT